MILGLMGIHILFSTSDHPTILIIISGNIILSSRLLITTQHAVMFIYVHNLHIPPCIIMTVYCGKKYE